MFDWVLNTPVNGDPVHNNLKSYKVLVQSPFTTIKTELGMEYKKFYIQLASPAAKQLMA